MQKSEVYMQLKRDPKFYFFLGFTSPATLGGSRKKIEKKIIPSDPTNKNV